MDVSIIIVSYNTKNLTLACLKSIVESETAFSYEILVVDNNSSDGSQEAISVYYPEVTLIKNDSNVGFSAANNIGIRQSIGTYKWLLNSDTVLFRNTLELLISCAKTTGSRIFAPKLLNPDLSSQKSLFREPTIFKIFLRLTDITVLIRQVLSSYFGRFLVRILSPNETLHIYDKRISYASFASILIHSDVFTEMGLLDEHLTFYHEDCEFGLRVKKNGERIYICNISQLIHFGGSSSDKFSFWTFKNDISGLLYVYKKYYSKEQQIRLKKAILIAMKIRLFLVKFGFYTEIKKMGVYVNQERASSKIDIDYIR
ncbi:glycosyltransferase family 2 protein, partial [Pararcticibacter amylolyticus]